MAANSPTRRHGGQPDTGSVLIGGFAVVIALLTAVIAVGVTDLAGIHRDFEKVVTVQNRHIEHLSVMRDAARERSLLLHLFVDTEDPFERDRIFMDIRSLGSTFLQAREALLDDDLNDTERRLLEEQKIESRATVPYQYDVIDAVNEARYSDATDILVGRAVPTQDRVMAFIDKLIDVQYREIENLRQASYLQYREGVALMLVLGVAALVVSAFVAGYVKKRISAILAGLRRAAERVNERLEQRVEKRTRELRETNERLRLEAREHAAARRKLRLSGQRLAEKTRWLERANRDLQQFAYVVSHDLKAPLRAVDGLTAALRDELGSDTEGETRKLMALLQDRVRRMHALVNGLLEYCGAGGGYQRKSDPVASSLKVLDGILERTSLPEGFRWHRSGSFPDVRAHADDMGRVFECLTDNAVRHHNQEQGNIWITGADRGAAVELRVSDDGPGIPLPHQDRIFGMFETLERYDVKRETGMGLALSRKIVETYGGTMSLHSVPGEGTTVIFTLPKADEGATLPPVAQAG